MPYAPMDVIELLEHLKKTGEKIKDIRVITNEDDTVSLYVVLKPAVESIVVTYKSQWFEENKK
jgi:hypothetical protein